ncbi:SIMPL domain-containing protein [Terriglobus saanensis]|uniref:DUF541 domain-containing protein n=1 Tax=Terriglobus saanensis (strain ATCC BAA-1853 / DSM 23119 / SP1PR4) TaxID=401053 RepID=E8V7M0_TERSS|nr:SIMPL domain-containing protein [Terriglobus saanensis]ADV81718.1 protein of unknown function DUF541 [Terriglobus saanensis SP1PR4]
MLRTKHTLGLLFSFCFSAPAVLGQCPGTCPERHILSIQATGTAVADADNAVVHVGYKVFGKDAQSAYSTASQVSTAIMEALLRLGLTKSAIESSSQLIAHTPTWELQQRPLSNEERQNMQFAVVQAWTVQVKPDGAADALHTAIEAGANESGWIEWKVADSASLQAKASAQALANARTIAEATMKSSNIHLGHLISITENQNGYAMGALAGSSFGNGGPINGVFDRLQNTPVSALAISSRRVEYTVSSYVTFALEP